MRNVFSTEVIHDVVVCCGFDGDNHVTTDSQWPTFSLTKDLRSKR